MTINVDDVNQVPTAYASALNDPDHIQGDGTVDESTDVTIYGFATDPDLYDNPITQFTWTQVHDTMGNPLIGNDPIVTLLPNPSSQTPTFTAPAVANGLQQIDLVFRLTVSDGTASSGPSYVTIHVLNTNDPPLPDLTVNGSHPVNNDPVQVGHGTVVTLDGSTSTDPNPADIPNLTYKWEQVSGTGVTLSPPSGFSSNPVATFIAPAVGTTLTFRLTVSDGDFEVPKEVNIVVVENNHPPVADAGQDQTVPEGALADLNGSAFDPDSDTPLTFSWEQTAGPGVTLMSESPDNSHMSFVAPTFGGQGGSLRFKVIVTDPHNASGTDEVTVNVYPNRPPVPEAGGQQTVNEGTTVGLNGSATDLDNNQLTYTWSQVSGPTVALSDIHDRSATFMAPEVPCSVVVVVMRLTVNDGYVNAFDDVTINIANLNYNPTASAGGVQSVNEEQLVTLNGSLSTDLDTEEIPSLTYQWMQTDGPGVTLAYDNVNDPQHIHPTFTAPDIPGGDPNATVTLKFSFTVTDLCGGSGTDTATITVANFAHPPIAVVQGPATVNEHTSGVMLSGTGCYDPDGDSFGYNWTQCAGPAVTLTGADSATPSFDAPWVSADTQLKFKLTVTDIYGLSSSAFVTLTVLNVNDPPTLVNPRPDVGVLWPPNHQLVAVHILGMVDPQNNATITIDSVRQDELTNGLGDGDTPIDAIINADTVLLRAERSGNRDGRVYHVCFTAADPEGSVTGCVNVMVPKSKKTDAAIDNGGNFDSTH